MLRCLMDTQQNSLKSPETSSSESSLLGWTTFLHFLCKDRCRKVDHPAASM